EWRGTRRRRAEARERAGDLSEAIDLTQHRLHVGLEDRPEIGALIGVRPTDVLDRQLDRSERVLDFVRDLPGHLTPGENAGRADLRGDVLEGDDSTARHPASPVICSEASKAEPDDPPVELELRVGL